MARGGSGGLHRRHAASDRPARGRVDTPPLPARRCRGIRHGRFRRGRPAVRRRQDPGGRGGHGPHRDDHPHPGHQHDQRPAVARRAARPNRPERGGHRRVLRRRAPGATGDHRHVSDPDRAPPRSVRAPVAAGRDGLGPHHLRRGPPAARAGVQADRGPAGASAPGADRHAGARGRAGGGCFQSDRPQALRRPMEGDRGPGVHLPGRVLRGAGGPARCGTTRVRRGTRRGALSARGDGAGEDRPGTQDRRAPPWRTDPRDRAVPGPDRRTRPSLGRAQDHGRHSRGRTGKALPGFPGRPHRRARGLEGRELLRRPARRLGRDPSIRDRSGPGRRRRSDSAVCCAPRARG